MTLNLPKGGNFLLHDEAPDLERLRVCIGWSELPSSANVEIDGVLSLTTTDSSGPRVLLAHQVPNPAERVGSPRVSGPVVGDAEKLVVTLPDIPDQVTRLLFGAAIFDAAARKQTFAAVPGAYVRLVNDANGIEIGRFNLPEAAAQETAMLFGELYRNPRGWKFRAIGQGYANGLRGFAGAGAGADEPVVARPIDVNAFMRRTSTARSHRSVAEHLHPPKAVPPAKATPPPAKATPPPAKATPPPAPAKAAPPPAPAKAVARPPVKAAPPPPKPAPAVTAPAAAKKPAQRSLLDLSEPDETHEAATATAAHPAPVRESPRFHYGEHSSRYRQREESVSALTDDHPATTWTEQQRGSGAMTVTLRWEPLKTSSGLPRPSDLHLAALWQANDRAEGLMQTLGGTLSAPGPLGPRQVLALGRRDEREGQTIFVDMANLPAFRRFFVFVYGQHGSPEWELLRPELTVAAPSGEQLEMRLGAARAGARLCVIASFHVVEGDLIIRRENDFLDGLQSEAAGRYGWQLEWNPDGMTVRR